MTWLDDKRKRDEEEAQHQRAAQEAAREQRTQEQRLKAEERAHRAAQESLRPASEQKVKTAPLVVNLDTQTNQSAARVASRIPDETERDGFLTEYIAHVKKQSSPNYQKYAPTIGTMRELTDAVMTGGVYADTRKKYDKQVQTRNEAMKTLAGTKLMGFDGKTIDVNTADPQTVMRGINMIADDEERASAAKAYKTLAGLEGSRFYGSNTDGVGTFLESGNMKADKYRSAVKGYRASFYGDGKHDEQDEAAYWAKTAEIAGRNYTDYAKAQYQAALDKTYRSITGKEIPTRREDAESPEAQNLPDAGQGNETPAENGAQTQKKGLLEAAADAVAGFFGGEPQAAEEAGKGQEKGADAPEAPLPGTPPAPAATPEPTTEPEPTATPAPMQTAAAETPEPTAAEPEEGDRTEQGEANEPARQAETASDKPTEGTGEAAGPIQQKERNAEEEIIARGGMSFAEWAEEHPQTDESTGGHDEEEKKQAGTLSDALGAMMRGELGEYEGEGVEELNRLYEGHELVRRVIGTFGEEDSKQIRLGNEGAEYAAARAMANMGTSFRTLEGALESSAYPEEVKTDILAQAVRWAARAEEMELAGTLPGGEAPDGAAGDARYDTPLLERYLTQTDEGKREYQATLEALRALDDQKAQMRRQQEEDERKALEEARQAVRSGYYSDEQLALVTENAKDVGYEQLMENGSWGELKERRSEIDGYLAGDGFEKSAVYSRMAADGMRDADAEFAYKTLLGDQMNVILQEEAATAYTLGMTLEEYLSAQGGMSMEQLGTLASARIEKMGASLTDEDEAALDKLEKPTYGEGVGAAAVVAGGVKTGAEQYYYDFKNSLYEGLTLSEVERTGARMQEQYQREYGLYGRDKYVSDLTEAALSGVWDESFSNAVMKALATSADPYTIGIDPGDVEKRLLLRGNRAIKADMAATERYIAQNGTEGENLWFGRVKSMTYNTVSAGVSTGAGMATGSGALGFIAGYSVVGYKNNLDEALEEGFSLKTGKTMAALNTAKDYAVNVGVFNKIFGQITGAGAPIEAAQDIITKNPTGAAKFLGRLAAFSEAALENELDEVLHDEFYETIGSNAIDATFGELLRKADAGESIGMSDWLDMMMAAANPASYDLYGTAKHVKETAIENAIGSILFSVAGGYGAAMHAYPSTQKAADVVSGKSGDIAGTLKAIREDLKDAEVRKAMDEDAAQQQLDRETARQLIYGADRNGTMAAAREAQAQADGYDRQAQSSRQAMDEAAQTLEAAQTALENGTAEPMTAQELADAAVDYAKAKQRNGEAESRQEQKRQEAEELLGLRTREARKAARAAVKAQAESAKAALLEDGQIENRWISEQIEQTRAQIDRAEAEFNDAMDRFEEAEDMGLDYDGMFEAFEEQADRYAEKLEALEARAAARSGAAGQEKTEEGAPQAEQTTKKPPEQAAENGGEDAQAVDMGDGGQYSLGEVGVDAGQEGADIGGLKNPIFQKFQSVIKKRHGTDVVVAELGKGVRSYYDGKLNRLFISSKIGTGEAMRVTLCHELTHSIEGSRGYEAYKEAALQAAYGGDEARMAHDMERIREVYEPIYERDVRTFTDADAENELVARATETVIERLADWTKTGGETQIYDLLGEKQRFGIRLYNRLTQFIARQRAKREGTLEAYDDLIRARDALKDALREARENENRNVDGKQYAADINPESHYDYSKPFREQVEDWQAGKIPEQDSLIVGRTPGIFRKIGLSDVPMTLDQRHTDYAVNAAKADHQMSMEMIERLPELLENPIAIIGSETRADDSLVAIIEATINGKPVVAPVTIQTTSKSNDVQIDANHLASAYGKKNAVKLLENAIQKENADGVGVYYLDKSRASNLFSDGRVQFPAISEQAGLIHSIFDAGSPVKRKYLEQTETRQFKSWFEGSQIVNEDGNPKIMYHGTREENGDFHVFDSSKAVKKGGLGMKALGAGNYFTATRLTGNERYGSRVIEAYLSIKKPLEVNAGETFGEAVRRETGLDTKDMGYDAIQQAMRERGYDGVVQHDKAGNITIAVAFDSEQIKSATDNIGLFDKKNPDIRYALDLNQFGGESAARTDSLVDAIRRELLGGNRTEKKIDREMVSQADRRYDEIGGDEVAARLRAKEYWTDEDITQAQVAMVRALEEKHDVEAAVLGKLYTLRLGQMGMHEQIENALKPLSTIYALAEAVNRANQINLRNGLAVHIPAGDEAPMSNPTKAGQRIINGDANFRPITDESSIVILKGDGKGEVTSLYERAERFKRAAEAAKPTYGTDNPWHIPMPEWKMELIDRYRLRGEKLPGYDYFKASTKERMLAAIIATDDNRRGDGLLTLCQQLEFMKKGYAVVTEADMNYITGEMATYQLLEGENPTPQTPEGRTIIQRIYSAQANTTPNNLWNKFNNFGYDNMLSSSKTWNKNIMSNVLTRLLEMGSELIGAGIDRLAAKKTGNRTTGLPQMEAIGEGHRAFAQEIANTLTDYIIRGVDTGHSSSFDFNHNNRTYNSAFMQAYHDFIGLAMQLGDRPFWEQCYTEEMDVLNRLGTMIQDTYEDENGDLQTYLREMTDEERHAEAERRATERVFQEDNRLIDAINAIRRTSRAADFCITTLIPFLKTPTNVAIRAMQYSPIGLAWTALKNGVYDAMTENGTKFDQRKFVMNMGRGLTGTGMMVIGMALAGMGVIKFGREDEDDARLAAIQKSEGKSYGMYFDILGEQIPLDFAFPAVSPLVIGAELYSAMDSYDRDEDGAALAANATRAIYTATLDQLFNNSMLSGLSNLLRGYQSNEQKVTTFVESMMENTASRLTPAIIRAVAKYTDPYVRDTKSQNALREMINANIIQNWPLLRQTLPTAKTLKGEDMLQNGANNWGKAEQNAALHFLNTFITPWTAGSEIRDAQLDELADIAYRTGETSWLPGELIAGNKYKVTITKTMAEEMGVGDGQGFTIQLTDEEKRWANDTYKDVLWNGSLYTESDIRSEMESLGWAYMPDEERIEAVKACQKEAKKVVLEELVRRKKQP